ncbi:MAG: T9SS type A sorting domain-containing protein, partial [Bacteroidota bacterium]
GNYLASNSNVNDAVLLTESAVTDEWKFSLASNDFNPSSSNFFGVVLMSDGLITGNIKSASWNGYYLQIGANGSGDAFELWRHSGTGNIKVGDFPSSPSLGGGELNEGANIRITRSPAGEFELFYELGSFDYPSDPTTSAGTLTNNTFTTSCYFGVFTNFNNTGRQVYLDNLNDNAVLPVNLSTFTAKPLGSTAQLLFTTTTEDNNSHFLIQRSTDGRAFKTIGRVEGKGNSNQAVEYRFTDNKPANGINYYRLQQFDFDGTNEFFGPVAVQIRGVIDDAPSIWPVPAKDNLQINFPTEDREWIIEVYDLNGRLLQSKNVQEKTLTTSLDLSQLPAGTYLFRWHGDQTYGQQRFIKQ